MEAELFVKEGACEVFFCLLCGYGRMFDPCVAFVTPAALVLNPTLYTRRAIRDVAVAPNFPYAAFYAAIVFARFPLLECMFSPGGRIAELHGAPMGRLCGGSRHAAPWLAERAAWTVERRWASVVKEELEQTTQGISG